MLPKGDETKMIDLIRQLYDTYYTSWSDDNTSCYLKQRTKTHSKQKLVSYDSAIYGWSNRIRYFIVMIPIKCNN